MLFLWYGFNWLEDCSSWFCGWHTRKHQGCLKFNGCPMEWSWSHGRPWLWGWFCETSSLDYFPSTLFGYVFRFIPQKKKTLWMDIDGFLQAYDTIGCCAFYVLLWFTEQFSGPDRLQCDKKRAPYSVISCYIRMKTITYYFIFFLSSFLVHPTCSG